MIRRLLLLIALCFGISSEAATVIFTVTNWNGTTPTNYVRVYQSPAPQLGTPQITIGRPTIMRPVGGVAQTNMLAGNYRLELEGIPNTVPIIFAVPDDTNTYQVTALITNSAQVASPAVAYTQAAANSKFVIQTNAIFYGSTNAFRFTNGVSAGQFLVSDSNGNWHAETVAPGAGISEAVTSINGDTNAAQSLVTDESGTDFAIATAGGTNTFSLPIASATKTGKLSSADWSTFNAKQAALGYTPLNVASNLSDVANAATARSNIGAGTGNGSVTSIGLTGDSDFQFGPAITTSGTIAISQTNSTGSGPYVRQTNATLRTPTIASFVNAGHNHQDSAGGGTLAEAALNLSDNTTANGTTNRHGLLPKLPNDATKYLDGTGAYSVPPSGSGTVTSVGISADSDFEITSSPITTSGTITISNTNTVGSGPYVRQTNSTLVTPTIASFANANHNHQDSAGGGLLAEAAVSGLTTDLAAKISNSLGTGTNATLKGTTLSGSTTNSGVGATKVVVTDSAGVETGATLSGLSLVGTTLSTTENGTVTSVAQTVPSQFQVTGSAITSSGTLAITITNSTGTATSPLVLQSNAMLAGATLSGSTTNSSLTASRPMKSDANKVEVSGQIDLSSANEVTGVLLAAGIPDKGTAGTYRSVTTDAKGAVTSGTNPTTFSGYGLSDTSANLASALTDETGNGVVVFSNASSQTNATLSGTSLSGTTTNTSTFSGTFTNTGAAGFSTNLNVGGQYYGVAGVQTAPTYSFAAATNSGFYNPSGGVLGITVGGTRRYTFDSSSTTFFAINSSIGYYDINGDLQLSHEGAAIWQLGLDATGQNVPTAQTLKGPDALAGTATNIAGANVTIAAGRNTGTGTGGSLIFQTAAAVASGTSAGILTNRIVIDNTGAVTIGGTTTFTNGLSSLDTTAAAAIAATGYTNTLGKLARVWFDGTAITFTLKDAANTPYYTNATAHTGAMEITLQASEAVTIAGTGVVGVRKPL